MANFGNYGLIDANFINDPSQPYQTPDNCNYDSNVGEHTTLYDFFNSENDTSDELGLSLKYMPNSSDTPNGNKMETSDLGLDSNLIEGELQRMNAEMDAFIMSQQEQLKKQLHEKINENQMQITSTLMAKFSQTLKDKDAQIQELNKVNSELEAQYKAECDQSNFWKQKAEEMEVMIIELQPYAEGQGDSDEVDSCDSFNRLVNSEDRLKCKSCGVNEMSMIILPCRHLCLCKVCEGRTNMCPICFSVKKWGVEIHL